MARARNIKHAFFMNDDLAERNCPLGRLLFIGLWTLADYKGELEWRAGKIKAQLLPYDECDIKQLAINLDKSGFIRFYSDGDRVLLNIPNFEKHQNPHKNEKAGGSDVPNYTEAMRQVIDLTTLTINRDLSGLNQDCSHTNPADSLILNPDSLDSSLNAQNQNSPPADNSGQPQPDNSGYNPVDNSHDHDADNSCTGEQLRFDDQHLRLARTTGLTSDYSDDEIQARFDLFRCYKANAKTLRTYAEWLADWRTWCQREKVQHAKPKQKTGGNSGAAARTGQRENNTQLAMRLAREAAERIAASGGGSH
uniref:hypothetical protein n=1 Tax=Rheinheimera sp. TaxID=1869214 RepID=UPI0040483A9B